MAIISSQPDCIEITAKEIIIIIIAAFKKVLLKTQKAVLHILYAHK